MKNLFLLSAAATLALGLFSATDAEACGGLFCDGQQPVNQAAERIIFSDDTDGTVTAVVQIQYQGPSERFAWVLPVPSVPDISVSSNQAFTRLQRGTAPQYRLTTVVEGTCAEIEDLNSLNNVNNFNDTNNFDSANNTNNTTSEPPVVVVGRGSVGP